MGKADRYQKLYPVTWDQLHRDAKALAWRLLEQGPFKGIIGVARGGLVPAAIVARELNIRLVDTLCICTYQSVFGNFSFYSYKKACGQKKTVRGSKNSRRLSNGTPAI